MKKYFYWCKKLNDDMITISVGEVLAQSYQEVESLSDFMQWPPTDKIASFWKIKTPNEWNEFWRNGFSSNVDWVDLVMKIKVESQKEYETR